MLSGLIDEGETAEQTAIRELEEETGFKADEVLESSPLLVNDPGLYEYILRLVTLICVFSTFRYDDGQHEINRSRRQLLRHT